MKLESLYENKSDIYYSHSRFEMLEYIPEDLGRVLDIGCGKGELGQLLKQNKMASEVVGVEITQENYNIAKRKLDEVILGNIEEIQLPFSEDSFDTIIFADSIEHLINPWDAIKKVTKYLKNGSNIIAFIPNTRNWKVIFPLLLFGDWDYKDWGLLDITHLRFFTKKTIPKLFNSKLFTVRIQSYIEHNSKSSLINTATIGLFSDLLSSHNIAIATLNK